MEGEHRRACQEGMVALEKKCGECLCARLRACALWKITPGSGLWGNRPVILLQQTAAVLSLRFFVLLLHLHKSEETPFSSYIVPRSHLCWCFLMVFTNFSLLYFFINGACSQTQKKSRPDFFNLLN